RVQSIRLVWWWRWRSAGANQQTGAIIENAAAAFIACHLCVSTVHIATRANRTRIRAKDFDTEEEEYDHKTNVGLAVVMWGEQCSKIKWPVASKEWPIITGTQQVETRQDHRGSGNEFRK